MTFRNRCDVFEITATAGREVAKSAASCSVTLATTNFHFRLGAVVHKLAEDYLKEALAMQLYLAQFVVAEANLYQSDQPPYELVSKEISYRIEAQLFVAPGAELAYVKALQMMGGFTDAHRDGPGNRTDFKCMGIHELEEIALGERSISESLEGPYGIDVGSVRTNDIVPVVRLRRDLAVFSRHAT